MIYCLNADLNSNVIDMQSIGFTTQKTYETNKENQIRMLAFLYESLVVNHQSSSMDFDKLKRGHNLSGKGTT